MKLTFTGNDAEREFTRENVIQVHRKARSPHLGTGERTMVHYPHTSNDLATSTFYEGESLVLRPEFGEPR